MTKEEFSLEIKNTQSILHLNDWDITYELIEKPGYLGELSYVDYKRFVANLSFDSNILNEQTETIRKVIMHEFCHIFTISSLRYFEQDEHMKDMLGHVMHSEMIARMDIINEQMTVRLEKLLSNTLLLGINLS